MNKARILLLILLLVTQLLCVNVFAEEKLFRTKSEIKIYGKVKIDLSYDDSRVEPGNYGKWVKSEAAGETKNDTQFNLTASDTQLGIKLPGPADRYTKTGGNLEVDFFDNTLGENKVQPVISQAYVEVVWPKEEISILAGQAWDIIYPLSPDTLNYSKMWWQGNVQYRRPQLRFTQGYTLNPETKALFQLALCRTIGVANYKTFTGSSSIDTGANSGIPTLQMRWAISTLSMNKTPVTLGFSGHLGKETHDLTADGKDTKDFDTVSMGLDCSFPLAEGVLLKGEFWTGKNMAAYLGGIGQGINTTLEKEIRAKGGWLALTFKPVDKWSFNLGAGMDIPKADDLNSGDKKKNEVIFGNVTYDLNEAVQIGVEVSDFTTKYQDVSPGAADLRIQASMIYNF